MPFGTRLDDQGVHFRLWAPRARRVDLCLEHAGTAVLLPMHRADAGWYQCSTDEAAAGSRYRFRIDGDLRVPDPASRFNPEDVHGPSVVVDPAVFAWQDEQWRTPAWHQAVIYELHVGTFTPLGTFAGVESKLDGLRDLGVTAIELMPVADFPGRRNWGYDGVLLYAPDATYGTPDDLKRLVQAAHQRGLMVLLDVVYNHFGPDGNYLHAYAPDFFTERHQTPWGAAIAFDGAQSGVVRDFYVHNALYWLEEYNFDGLRFDAVHAIADESSPHVLDELALRIREHMRGRHVHLVLENDDNEARHLGAGRYDAQWNDDAHHAYHVALTGEGDGYYADYADRPIAHLARTLAEGFAYQGDPSPFRGGKRRGESSRSLPPTAFVTFLQNHDQIGNRAFGERLTELARPEPLRAALEILLLAPSPPLLFMGDEWGASSRFPFFCDFEGDLAHAVTEGRRREFARFARFADEATRASIPDPCDPATFLSARLDWCERTLPVHAAWLALHGGLLRLRAERIIPLIPDIVAGAARHRLIGERAMQVSWPLADARVLLLAANLGDAPVASLPSSSHTCIHASSHARREPALLAPWSVVWTEGPSVGT